jgi:MFS family permease
MNPNTDLTPSRRETPSKVSPVQAFLVSGLGTALEYYDFLIYGLAAGLVFNSVFFPDVDPLIGTLYAFAAFGTGFLARPLGGIVIGHFGDRIGRRKMLILTLITMGVSTFMIGLLPDFDTIGMWAPALLVVLRLVQGFAAGGEWGGAALFGMENAPQNRRGFWGSFTSMGVGMGVLLGVAVFAAVSFIFHDQLTPFAWRIPFLIGGVLVIIGLFARMSMPEEEKTQDDKTDHGIPLLAAFRRSPRTILLGIGVSYGYNTIAYIGFTFFLAYLTGIGYGATESLMGQLVYSAVLIVSAPFFALLSDKYGRKKIMVSGGLAMAGYLYLYFPMVNTTHSILMVVISFAIVGAITGITQGPTPAFLGEQFPARMRYSGMSASYQLGAALGGGTASLIATALLVASGNNPISVAMYGSFAMLVLVLCSMGLRETAHLSNAEIDAHEKDHASN